MRYGHEKNLSMNSTVISSFISFPLLFCATFVDANINQVRHHWSGFYAGGYLGGASRVNVNLAEPLRLDNNAYWFRPYHDSFNYHTSASVIGGGTVGYNWQPSDKPYLLGVEGEYGYLHESGSSIDPNQIPYAALTNNTTYNTSLDTINIAGRYGYAIIGGRVGYVFDNLLFYVKSGVLFTNITSQYSSVKTEDGILAYLDFHGVNHITTYSVGGGVEYALPFESLSNLSVKIEYLYLGLNRTLSIFGHCSCDFLWQLVEHVNGIHTGKVGINYKF